MAIYIQKEAVAVHSRQQGCSARLRAPNIQLRLSSPAEAKTALNPEKRILVVLRFLNELGRGVMVVKLARGQ